MDLRHVTLRRDLPTLARQLGSSSAPLGGVLQIRTSPRLAFFDCRYQRSSSDGEDGVAITARLTAGLRPTSREDRARTVGTEGLSSTAAAWGGSILSPPWLARKELLASASGRSTGVISVLERLPARPGLLVLNYHRIGLCEQCPFDRDVFSATPAEFDRQLTWLKKRHHVARADEVEGWLDGGRPLRRPVVLLTFDDGYRDNYQNALPILRAHGLQGTFFLVTSYVGSRELPWWKSPYWVRHARRDKIRLFHPTEVEISLAGADRSGAIRAVLGAYKSPETTDPVRFLRELEEECDVILPSGEEARSFLNWDEAREMFRDGMHIGSHTHTHRLLSKLSAEAQREEMQTSRLELERQLHTSITWLAYPVGKRTAFNDDSRRSAQATGYRVALSYYGGVNRSAVDRYDVRRASVEADHSLHRFRWRATAALLTGGTEL